MIGCCRGFPSFQTSGPAFAFEMTPLEVLRESGWIIEGDTRSDWYVMRDLGSSDTVLLPFFSRTVRSFVKCCTRR